MRTLVSGASGLIGSALVPALEGIVVRLVRREPGPGELRWDPEAGRVSPADLEGFDAVVHLAAENVGEGRWTAEKKGRIRDSRVGGTRLLCDALARCARPPRVVACASAVGIYGDRGEERLTEESQPGTGFLADVAREWEAAARGARVVLLRFGVVLSARGGALARMLTPFKLGVGGRIGPGTQWMSWVSLDDAVGAIRLALARDELSGPVNVVGPEPATNLEFTRTLGRLLGRPTIFPMPAFAARLLLGEMADALLLSSLRVEPARLKAAGYAFRHPTLESALRAALA
jgi:uncharacterized protein (TIGR01777 family)